jgi:small subunit ribosomal protein S3Ae
MAKMTEKEKLRKKKWFAILAPRLFKELVIGEVYLYEAKAMVGRRMTVNMMNLTGNPRNQHINVRFKIYDVKESHGMTEILGFYMMPTSIKRLVRRGKTKIDDSLVVITADSKKVRIKPLIITNSLVKKPVAAVIRTILRNEIARLVSKLSYEQLIEEIMAFKIQKHLGGLASDITPIRESEIRAFELIEREGVKLFNPSQVKEVPKEEGEEDFDEEADDKEEGEDKKKTAEEQESEETAEDAGEEPAEEEKPSEEEIQ